MKVLLPFKGLKSAKSRWRDLGPRKHDILLSMLERNLETVAKVVGAEHTYLVTPEAESLELFNNFRGLLVSGRGLNEDLREARGRLESSPLAVLLPDLPFLETEDVEALAQAAQTCAVTICPDQKGIGTNALVLNPAHCMDFCFEGASAGRHQSLAESLKLSVQRLQRPGLERDCDEIDDLREFALI